MFVLSPEDSYDKRCGEVFLTTNGIIVFHCTICGTKYGGISEYALHIIEQHFEPAVPEDCMSTYSSDSLDDDINDENVECEIVVNEYSEEELCEETKELEILQEDEIPISEPKNILIDDDKVLTAVEIETENQIKWEEFIVEENEVYEPFPKKKKTSLQDSPPPKELTQLLKPLKSLTAQEILKANEAAASLNVPTFKRPTAKGKIPDSERKHKCNFCGFAFKEITTLIAHIKRHTDKKNYQCAYCSKMFFTRTEIEEHSRRHTNERPFACEYENCTKTFPTRSSLTSHVQQFHLKQKKNECKVCGYRCYSLDKLRDHQIKHTQERNHECVVCNIKFPRRITLLNHMKIHENKKEYKCKICAARFNQQSGLYSHIKSKHKD